MTKSIAYRCDRCGVGSSDERVFATLSCMGYCLRKAEPRFQLDLCVACFAEMLEWCEKAPARRPTAAQLIDAMVAAKDGTR